MSTFSSLLSGLVKPLVIAKLQELANDVTPEDIEKRLDLDGFFEKLENNPKYAELKPFLESLSAQGGDVEGQLALFIDAILDILPLTIAAMI